VKECFNQYKVAGIANVSISVAKGGRIASATVTPGKFAGTPSGACVEAAAKTAKFPPCEAMSFPGPSSFTSGSNPQKRRRPTIDSRTLEGFRTSRDGLRRAKLACAHAAWAAGGVGPALPVLKYISTFRSGSRPSLPAARLVGRMLRDIAVYGLPSCSQGLAHRLWVRTYLLSAFQGEAPPSGAVGSGLRVGGGAGEPWSSRSLAASLSSKSCSR